ncbi:hypothetical protein AB4Z54_42415 [Streptomyces sp. MCAF7]
MSVNASLKKHPGLLLDLVAWFLLIVVAPAAAFMRAAFHDGDHWQQTIGTTAFLTGAVVLLLAGNRELLTFLLRSSKPDKWRAGAFLAVVGSFVVFAYAMEAYAHVASIADKNQITTDDAWEAIFIFGFAVACGTVGVVTAPKA